MLFFAYLCGVMDYRIFPPEGLLEAEVSMPPSKSLVNRLLIIKALAGSKDVDIVADCDDCRIMIDALNTCVNGSTPAAVNIGASGTAMRFLTAYFACRPGSNVILDGTERMRQRPIGVLVDSLRQLGAEIVYDAEDGFPPVHIRGKKLAGGEICIDSSVSSQFLTALLLTAPAMEQGVKLTLAGEPVSRPYIRMTLSLMERCGVETEQTPDSIVVRPGRYNLQPIPVEGDWSAAGYWYEIAALTSGWVTLRGLENPGVSLQGDAAVARIYENLGVNTTVAESGEIELSASPELSPRLTLDMSDTPDLAQTVAATCALLGVPFRLEGLRSLRIKETDRLEAMRCELLKLGASAEIENDSILSWDGVRHPLRQLPVFDTYDDHRMAMALAPASIYLPGIVIQNAGVVDKSYPGFWDDLRSAGFLLLDPSEPIPDNIDNQ